MLPEESEPETDAETVLCPNCVFTNRPEVDFCARCGAPLGMMATIDPFKQTLSEGFAYRQAVEGSPKLIVVVGMWLLFLPGLLNLPIALNAGAAARGFPVIPTGSFFLSAFILYRTTTNFVRKRRELRQLPVED